MKIVPLMAILALSQTGISVPVTIYETATVSTNPSLVSNTPTSTQTVAVQTAIPTTVSASTQATTSTTNASGIMALLQTIYSAVTGSSSNSSSNISVSGSSGSWKSFLSSLFGSIGNDSSPPTTSPSSSSKPWQSSSIISKSSPAATTTQTPSTSTSSTSTTTSGSSQTDGIYDAIYNSSEQIDTDFAKSILDAHNQYRKDHGVDALSWAEGPYAYAKQNADNYDCSGVLTHTHGQYGENLAAGFPNGPAAVSAWYSEGDTFNYAVSNEYNHFTQVVWKGSTQVGCAYKDCSAEGWQRYVICEYNPPGNFIGEERANVLPPVA